MIELLSKKDQRIVRILDCLVDKRKTSLQALAKSSGVKERTLWTDIKRINDLCQPAEIVSTPDGVQLEIPSAYNERFLFSLIMEESLELSILEEIFLQKAWSIADLAEKFYLSEVTIRRILQHMNQALRDHHIQISSNPLEIKGNTQSIIQLFTSYFLEKYNRVNLFMKPMEIEAVEYLLRSIDLTEQLIQNNQAFNRLVLAFYVRLKFYIGTPQDTVEDDVRSYVNDFDSVNQRFRASFGIRLTPSIVHFCIPYLFDKTYGALTLDALKTMLNGDHELLDHILDYLNRFKESIGMTYSDYDDLVLSLYQCLKEASQVPYIVYDRNRHFVTHLEAYNPQLVNQAKELFRSLFSDERYHAQLYHVLYIFFTHWEGLLSLFKQRDLEIDVAIFFDSDLEHALFAKETLEHEFGDLIHFDVLDMRTYEEVENKLHNYEILITNKSGLLSDGCEIICLDEFFLDDSWSNLRKKLIQVENRLLASV